jgi:hypothetical protein
MPTGCAPGDGRRGDQRAPGSRNSLTESDAAPNTEVFGPAVR